MWPSSGHSAKDVNPLDYLGVEHLGLPRVFQKANSTLQGVSRASGYKEPRLYRSGINRILACFSAWTGRSVELALICLDRLSFECRVCLEATLPLNRYSSKTSKRA